MIKNERGVYKMHCRKILISGALVVSLVLVGCGAEEKLVDNIHEDQKIQREDNTSTLNYNVTKEILEIKEKSTQIFYPQIKNYPGELLMDYANQSLKRTANIYGSEDLYTDVNIGYEITKMDGNILSVLFKGTGKIINHGDIKIQHSINLDMASSLNEITYDNYIKEDEASQKEVKKILDEKAKEKGIERGIEAEGIRLYFKGEDVIFYYMPLDDATKEFIELSVPVEELEGYIHTNFGEAPAS